MFDWDLSSKPRSGFPPDSGAGFFLAPRNARGGIHKRLSRAPTEAGHVLLDCLSVRAGFRLSNDARHYRPLRMPVHCF